MMKTDVLPNIFVENLIFLTYSGFFDEQKVYWKHILSHKNVFTETFDQVNTSLLNKIINLFQKIVVHKQYNNCDN